MAAWPAFGDGPPAAGSPLGLPDRERVGGVGKGIRMLRNRTLGLALGLVLWGSAAVAQNTKLPTQKTSLTSAVARPVMVMIGSTQCFWLRAADGAEGPQKRSDRITDVFNKYLGGSKATFAVKPVGKKTGIYMNGDLTVTITPEDAKAAKAKSVDALTASWKSALVKAFEETKATK
jgi:hypothetical protein